MCIAVDMKKEKKRAYDTEHSCIARQCADEYLEKNGCVCRTTLHNQILCVLKEKAEWNNHVIAGGIWEGNIKWFDNSVVA